MAWLDKDDLDDWVEVVNHDGDFLGWMKASEARHLRIPLRMVESPPLYKEHPYIINHAKMAEEMGVLKAQDDSGVSEIQKVLLASNFMREQERQEKLRIRWFEETLFANSQDRYKVYQEIKENKDPMDVDGILVEETVPQNIEEFLAALGAFTDEVEYGEEEMENSGWLDTILSEDELDAMGD